MAISRRQPKRQVVHRFDQRSQYASPTFGKRCRKAGIVQAMGAARSLQLDDSVSSTPLLIGLAERFSKVLARLELPSPTAGGVDYSSGKEWSTRRPTPVPCRLRRLLGVAGPLGPQVVLALAAALSCGDETIPPEPPEPTRVTVSPSSLRFTALGDTARLSAHVHDQYGELMTGAAVTWASTDGSVAVVDSEGLVRSAGNGEAVVTATAGSASASDSATVMVAQVVSKVIVTPGEATLTLLGDTARLSALGRGRGRVGDRRCHLRLDVERLGGGHGGLGGTCHSRKAVWALPAGLRSQSGPVISAVR